MNNMDSSGQTMIKDQVLEHNPKDYIIIKGAKVHNLKNVDVAIPRNSLVVMTGVSGSGKSSLAIDTLFAEGQRRYVESLSSYARQFLMRKNKPDVEYIKGICPAIAIEQKVSARTTRSTVGSLTEIYDYLRLLFARIGKTFSPITGSEVKKDEVSDVVDYLVNQKEGAKVRILIPFTIKEAISFERELSLLLQKGFTRLSEQQKTYKIEECLENKKLLKLLSKSKELEVLIDRVIISKEEAAVNRISDSIQTAFFEGHGECIIDVAESGRKVFSNRFELDGMRFEEPNPHFFNFNSPYGACKTCEGFGHVMGIDPGLVFPDKNLSVYEGAIACWKGEKMNAWLDRLIKSAIQFDFPIHRAIKHLTEEEIKLLWTGNEYFKGLDQFFIHLESKGYKIQYRVMLSRYRGRTLCPDCRGSRLRKDAGYVKISEKSVDELLLMQVSDLTEFISTLKLSAYELKVAERVLFEIKTRLNLMVEVGLSYLSLNRLSNTLSGGETQRINLTRSLGSNLTDSLYILDEPSVGLHPKDTLRLLSVLQSLRNLGNTVVIVEHEEEIIRAADYIVDLGPKAGIHGGEIIYQGPGNEIEFSDKSLTGAYLSGKRSIDLPGKRRKGSNFIEIKGAAQHNLKDIDVKIPLNTLTVLSGVSGSGKTTLVKQILYPALNLHVGGYGTKPGKFDELTGAIDSLSQVEMVDQNPIGKSSRSNPVTYVKAYDAIRELFSDQQLAKLRGFKPKHFSFNVDGGRCDLCKGEGEVVVEMQFLADIHLECEDCKGKRFKEEVLDVSYKNKNIFDVLDMSVEEAMEFFEDEKSIYEKLKPLLQVGLGYIKLGQSSNTLSGGEAQRVKLASFLGKGKSKDHVFFIFDEPTTGLHFHDIHTLLKAFQALIEKGHTVLVIEHNIEIIKCADWVIDLGPEGGNGGGQLLFQGVPEDLVKCKESHTARFLMEKIG